MFSSPKLKVVFFPKMRMTKKILTRAAAKYFFFEILIFLEIRKILP